MSTNNNSNSYSAQLIEQTDNEESEFQSNEGRIPYLRWIILGFLLLIAVGAVSYLYIFTSLLPFYLIYLKVSPLNFLSTITHLNNIFIQSNLGVPYFGGILVSAIGGIIVLILSVTTIVIAAFFNYIAFKNTQQATLNTAWWLFSFAYEPLFIALSTLVARHFKKTQLSFAFGLLFSFGKLVNYTIQEVAGFSTTYDADGTYDSMEYILGLSLLSAVALGLFVWFSYHQKTHDIGRKIEIEQYQVDIRKVQPYFYLLILSKVFALTVIQILLSRQKILLTLVHSKSSENFVFWSSIILIPVFGLAIDYFGRRGYWLVGFFIITFINNFFIRDCSDGCDSDSMIYFSDFLNQITQGLITVVYTPSVVLMCSNQLFSIVFGFALGLGNLSYYIFTERQYTDFNDILYYVLFYSIAGFAMNVVINYLEIQQNGNLNQQKLYKNQ